VTGVQTCALPICALIRLEPGGYSANTDESGSFTFTLPVNIYTLTVAASGENFNFRDSIEISRDTVKRLKLSFSPLGGFIINHPLLGRAFLRDLSSVNPVEFGYSPLPGAEVTLTGAPGSLVTDSAGYFRYERVLSGLQDLEVTYEDKKIRETLPVTSKTDVSGLTELKAVSEGITLLEGSVCQISVYGLDGNNDIIIPSEINWSVADPSVGSINRDGVFIAKSAGRTEIYAESGRNTVIIIVIVTTGVGNISGRVTEEATGQPLSNVTAGVAGVNTVDITDINGEYFLEGIPANLEVILTVSRNGLLLGSRTVIVIPDTTVTADIAVNSTGPASTPVPTSTPGSSPTAIPSVSPTYIPTGGDMVLITGGTFQMGDSTGTGVAGMERPVHSVTVNDFYISKYEVTCAEYVRFLNTVGDQEEPEGVYWYDTVHMVEGPFPGPGYQGIEGGTAPGTFGVRPEWGNRPAVYVSWYGAVAYCNWLSEQYGLDKCYGEWSSDGSERWGFNGENFHPENNGYRLPTEAEWEYACRAGSATDYFWGENYPPSDYGSYCVCKNNSGGISHWNIASFLPNSYGLYDMSGNVFEWCSDWYSELEENNHLSPGDTYYYNQIFQGHISGNNPVGPPAGTYRVFRGGGWDLDVIACRSSARYHITYHLPTTKGYAIGFRFVRRL